MSERITTGETHYTVGKHEHWPRPLCERELDTCATCGQAEGAWTNHRAYVPEHPFTPAVCGKAMVSMANPEGYFVSGHANDDGWRCPDHGGVE